MSLSTLIDNSTLQSVTDNTSTVTMTAYSVALGTDVSFQIAGSLTAQVAAVVPSASISGNVFTKTAHGLVTGTVGQFTTSDTLPTGIVAVTNYWIIRLTANTFSVGSSLANAQAGTAVVLSDAGVGNQTFTPTSGSGVIKLQQSCNGTTWFDVSGDSLTINGAVSALWAISPVTTQYYRTLFTPTSGVVNFTTLVNLFNRGYSL